MMLFLCSAKVIIIALSCNHVCTLADVQALFNLNDFMSNFICKMCGFGKYIAEFLTMCVKD